MFQFFKKRKQAELLAKEKEELLAKKATELQQTNISVAKAATENIELGKHYEGHARKVAELGEALDAKHEQWLKLVAENEELKKSLSKREDALRDKESDVENRLSDIRKQEIEIVARKAEVRNQESEMRRRESVIKQRDEDLDSERTNIKKRESVAQKLTADSRLAKQNCDDKQRKNDERKNQLDEQEKDVHTRLQELNERQEIAKEILEKAAKAETDMVEKERVFEEKRAEIEQKLNGKIEEYDQKIADMEVFKDSVDSVNFDNSEEGKSAKIVVQEAIRQAKKNMEDQAGTFGELQEKYCEGTFRGFATPIDNIDKDLKELQNYVKQIDEHAKQLEGVPVMKIVDELKTHLQQASKHKKAWEFSEAYRHICFGLATSKNYELLVEIFNEYTSGTNDDPSDGDAQPDEEPDYYEILNVDKNATREQIKKAHKRMASKWHPDKNPENKEECDKKMQEINQAKEILLDKAKRDKYDKMRKSQ